MCRSLITAHMCVLSMSQGGTVVNSDHQFVTDVHITADGKIAAVGTNLKPPKGAKVIDATGKV